MKAHPSAWMLTLVARSCRAGRTRAIRWTRAPRSCPVSSRSVVPCLPPASSRRQQNPLVPPSSSHLPLAKSALLGTSSEEDFAFDSSAGPRRPDAGLAADRRALSAASLSPVLGRVALDPGVARG
jgi:hypothetical protein